MCAISHHYRTKMVTNPKNNGNFLTNTKRAYNKFQIKNVALVLTFFKKTICLQDEQCVCADHRGVLDGAVPGHLPPALPVRHVQLLPRRQDHHRHLDCLLLGRLPLRLLHQGQLHRQAGGGLEVVFIYSFFTSIFFLRVCADFNPIWTWKLCTLLEKFGGFAIFD